MGGFPALMIKPPESPLQQYSRAQEVIGQQQQIQAAQLENQIRTRQLQDQDALTKAMSNWDGQNASQLPMLVLQNGGSGQAAMAMTQNMLGIRQKASEIAKDDAMTQASMADTAAKNNDAIRGRILNVVGMADPAAKQAAWDSEVTKEEQAGTIKPGQFTHNYPGDQQATALANNFALGSQLVKEAQERQKIALDAWKPVGGQLVNAVTGEKIGGIANPDSLNKALETRWQVMHPGEPLPDFYKMSATSTPTDFERVDKLMEGTEKSTQTKVQQDQIAAIRQQTFDMQRDKTDMNPVVGTAKDGRAVLVPFSQAQQMGLQNATKADADMVNKAYAARHWLNLAQKQAPANAEPQDMGITQLVDKLDKEGKLGPLAGRWNEFMAGKFGAGDPEYAALRAKMGLSTTLLMQAHVGSRGSAQMLEHFEDLANAGKMDGETLKAALGAEVNYVTDKAMDPSPPSYTQKPGSAPEAKHVAGGTANGLEEGATGTGSDGKKYVVKGGKWVAQ